MADTKDTLFFEHPCFLEKKRAWEKYRDLFEGEHGTLTGSYEYLWPHELELSTEGIIRDQESGATESVGQKIRRIRARRSRYLNMIEPVISNLVAMAFKKPIAVDDATVEMLGDDIKNIDGKGTSLESFIMGPLSQAYFLYGQPIVQVDAPANTAASRQDEIMSGFRPFMEVLDVLEVPDWQIETSGPLAGKYQWVRYEFEVVAPRTSAHEAPKEVEYCKVLALDESGKNVTVSIFREEDDDTWTLTEQSTLAGWTEVPVSTCVTNQSWVKDVAELQLVLFNLMSAYYNQLNTQAFQRIFVAGLNEKAAISISEYAVSAIPLEAKPFIIEPSSTEALVSAINSTADQIYKVAFNRMRSLPAGSQEAPGANTIAEMNAELIAVLKQALEELESVINSALKHYAMFKLGPAKGAAFDGKITLPKDIDTRAVAERLEIFMTYKDEIRKVLPWRKAELTKAASEMGYDDEDLAEILKGIEDLKNEPVMNPLTGLAPFMSGKNSGNEETPAEQKQDSQDPGQASQSPSDGTGSASS